MDGNDGVETARSLLIVDDVADNRRIAGAILRAAGWRVDEADSGAEALAALAIADYALVLLDIQMPVMDGYRTAEAIRGELARGRDVPILAFTALRDPAAIERALASGMDGHIAKPFTPESLVAAVAPWLPDGATTIDRLTALFGQDEIGELLARLAEQLQDALALTVDSSTLRGEAHRLAGIAGTLGFATLSRHWLDVSEGDDTALGPARVATRKALAELARREGGKGGGEAAAGA